MNHYVLERVLVNPSKHLWKDPSHTQPGRISHNESLLLSSSSYNRKHFFLSLTKQLDKLKVIKNIFLLRIARHWKHIFIRFFFRQTLLVWRIYRRCKVHKPCVNISHLLRVPDWFRFVISGDKAPQKRLTTGVQCQASGLCSFTKRLDSRATSE